MPRRSPPLTRLRQSLDNFALLMGHAVAWLALLIVLLTTAVVVLRYAFGIGHAGLQESVLYAFAALFLLASPMALKKGAHVRVDIFYQRWSPRTRAWVDLLGGLLLLLPTCIFMGWISWEYVAQSWLMHEKSAEPGGLPWVYLLKSLILVGAGSLVLQGIAEMLGNLLFLLGAGPATDNDHFREEGL